MKLKSYIAALHAALFAILLAVSPAGSGSMTLLGAGKPAAASGCADSNVVAWKAAVVTAGGTVSAGQETRVCTLVTSLKAHSLFTVQDRIWLFASENSQQATIDLVNLAVATPTNSPTFTASQGYAGNGTTSYVDTGFGGSAGVNFTQNSAAISIYVRTNRTSAGNLASTGTYDDLSSGNDTRLMPYGAGAVIVAALNVTSGSPFDQFASPVATAQGFQTVSRTGSTTLNVYRNSSSTTLNTSAAVSGTLFAASYFIGAVHVASGGGQFFSDDQIAIAVFGVGLSGANAAQLQTDLNTYMTALGTNVY